MTLPVVAALGTITVMAVSFHFTAAPALAPLKVTVLLPWVDPNPEPVILTPMPGAPEGGFRLLMNGEPVTVKSAPVLAAPATVTTTLPVLAPTGAAATIRVSLHTVGAAGTPLNVTVLVPWVEPKFAPVMVTALPAGPDVGDRPVRTGAGCTLKATPLLATPLTVTTTSPVVAPAGTATRMPAALHEIGTPAAPWKVTVLPPCAAPKLTPAMFTSAPTAPEPGVTLVMTGAWSTVKLTPLLAFPPTVTTTLPVVAAAGTAITIPVALQLIAAPASAPLNVTVLLPRVAPKFVPAIVTAVPLRPMPATG